MKKLALLATLLFSVMFSSASYAEWTKVSSSGNGASTFYVDFERIRKVDGYVYYWVLNDLLKPELGDLSVKVYFQGDCKLFRVKRLSASFYTQPMGEGTPSTIINKPKKEWVYPSPNSVYEGILKSVCDHVK